MLEIRNSDRYGKFKANSSIGEVYVELSISGFGEKLKIYDKEKTYVYEDTGENEEDCWLENDEYIKAYNERYDYIYVQKPFIKCLKKY